MPDQLNAPFTASLPEKLRTPENVAKIKIIIRQWTQLVAWTWTTFVGFDQDETKKAQEQQLKEYFSSLLKNQALNRMAAIEYGDPQSAQVALETSKTIKEVITCSKTAPGIELNLSDVYEQLTTNKNYIFTDPLIQQFRFEVTVDSYTGHIRYDEEHEAIYVATIAYPPRPVLSEFTVTEQQLNDWMRDKGSGDYLPPSPYIPLTST